MTDQTRADQAARTRIVAAARRAGHRLRNNAWPILQQSLAAAVAWLIASHFASHHMPFFAPIAAVVALNTRLGGRGRQALWLLLGVTVGILVGGQTLQLLGNRAIALPIAVLAAMLCAAAVGGARVTLAQSAASAVLTVTIPYGGGGGLERLFDAAMGVAVALLFSQVLFPPHPLRLIRSAETAALQQMALGLEQTVTAMRGRADTAERALRTLRQVRHELDDVGFVQTAGVDIARRSLIWRHQRKLTIRESAEANQLQYLGPDCLTVARVCLTVIPVHREPLTEALSSIADVFRLLANGPASARVRSQAAHLLTTHETLLTEALADAFSVHADDALRVAIAVIELLVTDTLVFCGVGPGPAPERG